MKTKAKDCEKCGLYDCPYVPDQIQDNASIFFLGEAPGAHEAQKGYPFAGVSGKLLRSLIEKLAPGIPVGFLNSCHCRPPGNRTPTKQEIRACNQYLIELLKIHRPRVIVALGAVALSALTFNFQQKISDKRGHMLKWTLDENILIVPTFHPAFILRNNRLFSFFRQDIEFAFSLLQQSLEDQSPRFFLADPENLESTLEILQQAPILAVDIETTGLDPFKDRLLAIGIADSEERVFILPEQIIHSNIEILKNFFSNVRSRLLWHNGKFDVRFLKQYGIEARIDEDTLLLHYVLKQRREVHDLKSLALIYLRAQEYAIDLKNQKEQLDPEKLYPYLAKDCNYTFRLFKKFEPLLDSIQQRLYRSLLIPAANLLTKIEFTGIPVDINYIEHLQEKFQLAEEEARIKLKDQVLDYLTTEELETFNPSSPKQVALVLSKMTGIQIESTRADQLEAISQSFPRTQDFVRNILEFRKIQKRLHTYLTGLIKFIKPDERLHPVFMLHGTATGRLSSNSPNAQNFPRDAEIRDLIAAPPGHLLLEADFSQIELRVLACCSQDENLLKCFQEGRDLHQEIVDLLFKDLDLPEKEKRVRAKMINFGIVYGKTADSLAVDLDISHREAEEILDFWFSRFPKVKDYLDRVRKMPLQGRVLQTRFGRRRVFDLITYDSIKDIQNEAANFEIQSTASDLNLISALILDQKLASDISIINLIHDAILFLTKEEKLLELAPLIKSIMEQVPQRILKTDIPFPVELKAGKRYGSLSPLELS